MIGWGRNPSFSIFPLLLFQYHSRNPSPDGQNNTNSQKYLFIKVTIAQKSSTPIFMELQKEEEFDTRTVVETKQTTVARQS